MLCTCNVLPFVKANDTDFAKFFQIDVPPPGNGRSHPNLTSKSNYLFSKTRFLNISVLNKINDSYYADEFAQECKYYDIDELNNVGTDLGLKEHVTCLTLNCCDITCCYDSFCDLIHDVKHAFDFIVLTETWLLLDNATNFYSIDGFTMVTK